MHNPPIIGIVGVCASGKSTLINGLSRLGYSCRHIAQEHSYVQNMWKRVTNPDILIYLETSYSSTIRRKNLNWTENEYNEQIQRLSNAKAEAQIIINTDLFTPEKLIEYTVEQLSLLNYRLDQD